MSHTDINTYLVNWTVQFKKSLFPFFILETISIRRSYGYMLITCVKDKLDMEINEGTIYPILQRLCEEKLIQYEWVHKTSGIPRKYYYITDKGSSILQELRSQIEIIKKI